MVEASSQDPIASPVREERHQGVRSRLLKFLGLASMGVVVFSAKLIGWLPGYAKVPKEALLHHDTRAAILARVTEDPGITAAELSKELETPYNTMDYHLRRLQNEQLVARLGGGKRKHLFQANIPPADRARLAMLRNANTVRLLETIRGRPGLHQRALAAAIDIQPTSLAWHLARLQESGLIRSARVGRTVVWFTTESSPLHAS